MSVRYTNLNKYSLVLVEFSNGKKGLWWLIVVIKGLVA